MTALACPACSVGFRSQRAPGGPCIGDPFASPPVAACGWPGDVVPPVAPANPYDAPPTLQVQHRVVLTLGDSHAKDEDPPT